MDSRALVQAAEEMARAAGEILLECARTGVAVERKGDVDLVTRADRASEAFLVAEIRRRFEGHAVLAEEGGAREGAPGAPLWIVDPLDGTTNFAHGIPLWSVSIGVQLGAELLAGVVHDPNRNECFTAARGHGAFCNGRRLRVTREGVLGDAVLVTGFPYDVRSGDVDNLDHFRRLMKRCRAVRRLGSAALDLAWVAAGRFAGFWELKLHAWDVAAGALLVREAGGSVAGFGGEPWSVFSEEIVAASPALMPALHEVLVQGRRPPGATGKGPCGAASTDPRGG